MPWCLWLVSTVTLLAILLGENSITAQFCPRLNSALYGSMQCTGNAVNDRCAFQCNQGYRLTANDSRLRRCICITKTKCMWTASTASCYPIACPIPKLYGATYKVVDLSPTGTVAQVTVSPTARASSGWSAIVIFSYPLPMNVQISSFSVQLSAISANRRALTFTNRAHNSDLSTRRQYDFTFSIEGENLTPESLSALVGFYDTRVSDGSCFLEIKPGISTTASASASSRQTPSSSTPTTTGATTTSLRLDSNTIQDGCRQISYLIDNSGWAGENGWNFIFRYRVPTGDYRDWAIKVVFSQEVARITTWDSVASGPYQGGRVWLFTPRDWNKDITNQQMDAIGMSITSENSAPKGVAIICNNGVAPDLTISPADGNEAGTVTTAKRATKSSSTTTTTSGSVVTVDTTVAPPINPSGPSGILPMVSRQTEPNFKRSADVTAQDPYDYNELLHKSILFYEAQRSGKLPASNRIPWRGDSGLKDGCIDNVCAVDLTGGWYDAGDFVKFGFPMAWSTTVLAWGMNEFRTAYEDAGEWSNALSMIRWSTDYLVKAHATENELYFQVGDPAIDHTNWGHPETMTMQRPFFKVDPSQPGSEVAAESAAALTASFIVFNASDPKYAAILLSHAIQLYNFAGNFRGHYHVTVKESGVGNFYKSFSGYNDELLWAAIWLYKATRDQKYLNDAVQQATAAGTTEFSWDQKGPGALFLLSQERPEYKSDLFAGIDYAISKTRTPGGLTHFSDWGSNRYAANYALIALMAAKTEGLNTPKGQEYYNYGKNQIEKMLGKGDENRSYVVGFGTNPPQRPHHRASSCRRWSANPTTQVCDWSDRDADRANPQILYGALVGGPTADGNYVDDRKSYVNNEVAVDYNAGFQSAVAGLKYFQMLNRVP